MEVSIPLQNVVNLQVNLPTSHFAHGEGPPQGNNISVPPLRNALICLTADIDITPSIAALPLVTAGLLICSGVSCRLTRRHSRAGLLLLCPRGFFIFLSGGGDLDGHLVEPRELIQWRKQAVAGDGCSAERAVGVALEPSVNAVDVEDVEAGRQHPDPLLVLKFTETHRALAHGGRISGGGGGGGGGILDGLPVPEGRQCLDDGFLEPARLCGWCAGDWEAAGARGGRLALSAAGNVAGGVGGGAAVPLEAAPDDEDVVGEEEHGGGEDAEHGEHEDGEAGDGSRVVGRGGRGKGVGGWQWGRRWWWEKHRWNLRHREDGAAPACIHGFDDEAAESAATSGGWILQPAVLQARGEQEGNYRGC
jgi:hypothetical protein